MRSLSLESRAGIALASCLCVSLPALANDPPPPLLLPPDPMCWNVPDAWLEFGHPEIPPIPADFFGPGSEPFVGIVPLHGGGGPAGGCDLQLQRLGDLSFPGALPEAATIPIEIVALDLVSVDPIVVQLPGEDTLWDVRVSLAPSSVPGDMTATRLHTHGGILDGVFPIQPQLTFVRLDDPTDIRELPLPSLQCLPPVPWPWVSTTPDGTMPNPPGCFLPPCVPPFCPPCPLSSAGGGLQMGVVQGDAAFPPRCIAPNDGTIGLPGPCPWLPIPGQPILLPVTPDSSIEMHFNVDSFFDIEYQIGGTFGPDGEIMTCQADLTINVRGTGALTDFERTLFVPVNIELHWPSADPAASQQDFPNEMVRLEGELFGDPDFDSLHIEGGSSFDLPSPGHTKRTQLPGGNFHVDSFFDIVYRIEWQGAPGSILDGLRGLAPARAPLVQGGIPPMPGDFFGLPMVPVGGAVLGEDPLCDLVVSNIGSSGLDGVRIDLGDSSQGMCVKLDLPPGGTWPEGMRRAEEGFFDLALLNKTYWTLEGNPDGSARIFLDPGSLPFEGSVLHAAVIAPDGTTAWSGPMPELIVSNIGSSGKDGVSMCLSVVDNDCCPPWVDPSACEGLLFDLINPLPTDFLLDGEIVPGQQLQIFAENASGVPTPPMFAGCVSGANSPVIRILDTSMYMHCSTFSAVDGGQMRSNSGALTVSNIGSSGCDGVSIDLGGPDTGFHVDSFFDIWTVSSSVNPSPPLPGALHFTGVEPDEIDRGVMAQMGVSIADNGDGGLDLLHLFGPDYPLIDVDVEARLDGGVQDSFSGPMSAPWAVIDGANWPGEVEARRIPTVPGDEIMVLLRPAPGAANFLVTISGGSGAAVEADEIIIRGLRPGTPVRSSGRTVRRGGNARGDVEPESSGFSAVEVTGTDLESFSIDDVSTELPLCPGDANGDRTIGLADLLSVLSNWGGGPEGDVDGSGTVGLADLLMVLSNWGNTCTP